jgi:tetratricopeptide (TPR) repeat protein
VEESAGSLINLGLVHSELGESAAAEEVTRSAAQRFERLGHGSGRAICYGNLADFVLSRGDVDEARAWAERSLAVSRAIGHRRQAAVAQLTLAEIAVTAGRPGEALQLLPEARRVFEEFAAEHMVEYCDAVQSTAQTAAREAAVAPPGPGAPSTT